MSELHLLKNIGREMEKKLLSVGIMSAEDLKRIGSKEAFARLKEKFPYVCLVHLQALQGVVEDIRLQDLSEEIKKELKEYSEELKAISAGK